MSDKTGVLIVTPFYEPNIGGVETHLKDLTDYLRKDGRYRIYVLTYQPITTHTKAATIEKNGPLEIIRIPWIGYNLFHKLEPYPILEFLYISPALFFFTFIFVLSCGKKISTIHAQGFNAAFIGCIIAPFFAKRLVISIHAIYNLNPFLCLSKLIRWTLKKAYRVLTLSVASKTELIKIGLGKELIDVYTYWVDQERFSSIPQAIARKHLGWADKFTVLFVGRLIEKKGPDILLKVAEEISEEIIFVFIGDGPFEKTIKKASINSSNVKHIGKVENIDLPFYYSAADVLCVPSKYEEGFGRVILESLSCGTPIVASNRGGMPEAVDESVGMLVEADAMSFKEAILKLFNNREKLNILRNNCRSYALKRFSAANARIITDTYF